MCWFLLLIARRVYDICLRTALLAFSICCVCLNSHNLLRGKILKVCIIQDFLLCSASFFSFHPPPPPFSFSLPLSLFALFVYLYMYMYASSLIFFLIQYLSLSFSLCHSLPQFSIRLLDHLCSARVSSTSIITYFYCLIFTLKSGIIPDNLKSWKLNYFYHEIVIVQVSQKERKKYFIKQIYPLMSLHFSIVLH